MPSEGEGFPFISLWPRVHGHRGRRCHEEDDDAGDDDDDDGRTGEDYFFYYT